MDKITIQTVISIIAAFISLSTVIVSIYYNQKNSKQYLKSLDPLLSFKLFELKDELYLRVTNTGRSAAKDVLIEIKKLENNGDRNELELDALFGKEIELYDYDADGAINDAIVELNYRFKQHNLGYEFANSQIITIDSTFLHKTAVKPALKLLFEEGFEGAEDEIRNAYERRRKGDNKNAILEAGKAFESTMKIICDKQGYAYDKNKDTAQKLITILENNGFYPSYMNAHLTSIRKTLETGLPVVRNKVAGHGQGNQIITIPDEYTDYALHLAATNILFLVRLYRNKKQNP